MFLASSGDQNSLGRALLDRLTLRLPATPLLLLQWSPGSLAAPATLGLTCALFRTVVSPWLGGLADEWDRMTTVWIGTSMQAVGCLFSVGALLLYNILMVNGGNRSMDRHLSLALVIAAGVIETLGANLFCDSKERVVADRI